jgi:hypothetical protein
MKKLVLAVTVLALCSLSFAGTRSTKTIDPAREAAAREAKKLIAQSKPHSPFATSTCSYTFTSSANGNSLKYCVSVNGNIVQLSTPIGAETIAVGRTIGEGYGVCDTNTFTEYFDYADFGDSGNWGPATLVSLSATTVKISRSTTDGVWTLTQTITQVAATSSVKVAMTLKNNTAVARGANLVRYVDANPGNAVITDEMRGTSLSAFAFNFWDSVNGQPLGLLMQNAGPGNPNWSFAQDFPDPPPTCGADPVDEGIGGGANDQDGSLVLNYGLLTSAHGSKTATFIYKGL